MPSPPTKGVLHQSYALERQEKAHLRFRFLSRAQIVAWAVKTYLPHTSGLSVLDFGAAEGRTLLALHERLPQSRFLGIEFAADLIAASPKLPPNIVLMQGDVAKLPQSVLENEYDLVCALALLEHLKHPQDAVKEAYRVLKPGGIFVASCPEPFWDAISGKFGLLKDDQHETDMNKKTMIGLIRSSGLEVLCYKRFMWAPIAFLPYFKIPVPVRLAHRCDQFMASMKIFNWLFVNQVIIGRKG